MKDMLDKIVIDFLTKIGIHDKYMLEDYRDQLNQRVTLALIEKVMRSKLSEADFNAKLVEFETLMTNGEFENIENQLKQVLGNDDLSRMYMEIFTQEVGAMAATLVQSGAVTTEQITAIKNEVINAARSQMTATKVATADTTQGSLQAIAS